MRRPDNLIIVNGVQFPTPDAGLEIIESTAVNEARDANNAFRGQVIGRPIWKINNLQWSNLDAESWKRMKEALKPFVVDVIFTDDMGERHECEMYPGDRTSQPMHVEGLSYTKFKVCKFNLIDCGR